MRERAVSTTVSYVLTLGITAILVGGLLTAGGTVVDNQQTRVTESELRVVGQRFAADLATADRLVQLASGSTDISVTSRLPPTVVRRGYTIAIEASNGNVSLNLSARQTSEVVTVDVANTTAIEPVDVTGGTLDIVYNEAENRLEVEQ